MFEVSDQANNDRLDLPTVEQLEEDLTADPTNLEIQENLVQALLNRYRYKGGSEHDLERLKRLLTGTPQDRALFERAYLAWLNHDDGDAIEKLYQCALHTTRASDEPLTSDELWGWVFPFMTDPPQGLWGRLAEVFSHAWADSAAVLTLRGMAEDDSITGVDYLVQALERDETFWLAAGWCASIYANQKNWRAARGYYVRALKSESAASLPMLHFDLAWCYGKIREYELETQAYKACLELAPDYPYARNNLGWSLMKARKYDEAATVFRDAIQCGNDGKYPLRNLARALRRLGRFSEAIEILRQDVHRGAVTRTAQKQILELEALIRKQAAGEQLPVDVSTDAMDDEDELVAAPALGPEDGTLTEAEEDTSDVVGTEPDSRSRPMIAKRPPSRTSHAIQTEETLETLLEEMIQGEGQAFGRRLRMFESLDGLYGRQLAIPGIGRIDLLAEDLETHELVVIELKRDKSTDEVVGQLCRYLGWVQENLAKGNQKVRGIICVHRSSEKLRLAVSAVSGIEIFEYTLNFMKV